MADAAVKLILAAVFSEGLKTEVMITSLGLLVSLKDARSNFAVGTTLSAATVCCFLDFDLLELVVDFLLVEVDFFFDFFLV